MMDFLVDQLILSTACAHVLLAPYTKVEESFNLHAVHDVLMYGVQPEGLSKYDHFVFPGAVPRTFVGSILLAWSSYPVIRFTDWMGRSPTKFEVQIIVRLALSAVNAFALRCIRESVSRRFGRSAGFFFVFLTCSQFHLPFWMGRTLPNMFALVPVSFAWSLILDQAPNATKPSASKFRTAVALLVFTSVVFRSEVLLLLVPLLLHSLWNGYATFRSIVRVGLVSGIISLVITVGVDSYFWNRWPLWPEFVGLYFNVIEGKSSKWGVSPFHTYFSRHLPKLLLGSLPLSIIGSLVDHRVRSLLFVPITFILLISCLGHKEWRFIIYVVPLFNVAAARGASWIASIKKSSIVGRFLFLTVIGIIISNLLATALLLSASIMNYPGGQALAIVNAHYADRPHVHVHIDNFAAQSGASLFLHTHAPPYTANIHNLSHLSPTWVYNKTEHLTPQTLMNGNDITHLIAEEPCPKPQKGWHEVQRIPGFIGWKVNKNIIKERSWRRAGQVLRMIAQEKLCILERE